MTSVDRIQGLSGQQAIKTPCRLATTANITLSGEQTIDGVAAVEGDRVLVKDQTTTTQNGVYDVSTSSWTRSLDFDGPNDITDGTMVLVNSGSTYADKVFKLNATEPITIDTTALTFTVATDFTDISAFAATLLDDANAAAMRTTLGLGTAATAASGDFQAADEQLAELAAITPAQGDIIYHNGTDWVKLAAGTSGHFLKTLGAGANPAWAAQTTSVFTAAYDSGNQTITGGGALSLTHSLGAAPRIVQAFLKCTDAGGDIGYAENDIVSVGTAGVDAGSASVNAGISVVITSTTLEIRYGNALSLFYIPNKSTGASAGITNTKWAAIFRAYA